LASLVLAVAVAGCGGTSGPDLVPVTGQITENGNPLAGAGVTFTPQGQTEAAPSWGKVDENGRFELVYNDGRKGAVPGKHQVVITVMSGAPPDADAGGAEKPPGPVPEPVEHRKEAEVNSSGENDFTFDVAE
jgi:hypothetical protein